MRFDLISSSRFDLSALGLILAEEAKIFLQDFKMKGSLYVFLLIQTT